MNSLYQIIKRNKKEFFILLSALAVILVLAGIFYFKKEGFLTDDEIQALKSDPQNLVLDGSTLDIDSDANYKSIYLIGGSHLIVKMPKEEPWPTVTAAESIFISKDSEIRAGYQEPSETNLTRAISLSNEYGGDGGALAGPGGYGDCLKIKRDALPPLENEMVYSGAAGAAASKVEGSQGGRGGGIVSLRAEEIFIYGAVNAEGENGTNSGGGGSGGYVLIQANRLTLKGLIDVSGGDGGDGQIHGGGGGSGGIIRLSLKEKGNPLIRKSINLSGGQGGIAYDIYTGCRGGKGTEGQMIVD